MNGDVPSSLDSRQAAAVLRRHAEGLRATATELSEEIAAGSGATPERVAAVRTELSAFAAALDAVVGEDAEE